MKEFSWNKATLFCVSVAGAIFFADKNQSLVPQDWFPEMLVLFIALSVFYGFSLMLDWFKAVDQSAQRWSEERSRYEMERQSRSQVEVIPANEQPTLQPRRYVTTRYPDEAEELEELRRRV